MPDAGDSIPPEYSKLATLRRADAAAIAEAGQLIGQGKLVAFPTETVYGLGADATNGQAVARIFEAKGRPRFNPLIVHAADLGAAEMLGNFLPLARRLADAFWPGPLTLIVDRKASSGIADLTTAGLTSLAIRVPNHPVAQALLRAAGRPLAAPSANRSGHVSATRADHVAADLGPNASMILDAGATTLGLESTVLDVTGQYAALLRPGAIAAEEIEQVLGRALLRADGTTNKPISPGQLASHYAPRAPMRLNVTHVEPGEVLLAFGPGAPATTALVISLSAAGDLVEAASNLFAALRLLDQSGAARIAVMPIPAHGLGEAINDRLQRAAAPRPGNA